MVSAISPDIIINLAALTNVDLCESNPDLAHAINFQGVKNLVNVFKGPIIHLSTDYVFDGKLGQYKENDITNPINVYGVTKFKAEKILLEKSKESLVIRTNVLYDYQSQSKASFLNWVVDSLNRGEKIKVVDDQFPADFFYDNGFDVRFCGQKSYNGVCLAFKRNIGDFSCFFINGCIFNLVFKHLCC